MRCLINSWIKRIALLCAPFMLSGCKVALMDPMGRVGEDEKTLILTAFAAMLLVVVPVIFMAIAFSCKYRASNKDAEYKPDWAHSYKIETIVWGVPVIIVTFLAILCWKSTHLLDPARPIDNAGEPLEIKVVSLDWKWLFIYPDQKIASVNEVAIPVGRQVRFVVTSDSVMNAFFIPQLGTQVYAMAGMAAKLHLVADHAGAYDGISSNFSGQGFSHMKFKALALPDAEFEQWIKHAKNDNAKLDQTTYTKLAEPSEKEPVRYYGSVEPTFFDQLMAKYMAMPMAPETPENNLPKKMDHTGANHVR